MIKLSIVIITKNEEENIARCLKSCLPLHAEIIVLDSGSSDNTVRIAESFGAQVLKVVWQGYGPTKNVGALKAKHNWILSLDADEALDDSAVQSMNKIFESEPDADAYTIRRFLVIGSKRLHFGALLNEKRLRLYNKNIFHWNHKKVHEDVQLIKSKTTFKVGTIDGSILHYSYKNEKDMRERLNTYAQLIADDRRQNGKTASIWKSMLNPAFSFIKNYFFRGGFLDGYNGFLFAKEQARYVYKKYSLK